MAQPEVPNIFCKLCKIALNPRENLTHFNQCHLSNTRKLKCDICNQNFNSKSELSAHILSHENIKTNKDIFKEKCKYCCKEFEAQNLAFHVSLMHSDIKNEKAKTIQNIANTNVELKSNVLNKIRDNLISGSTTTTNDASILISNFGDTMSNYTTLNNLDSNTIVLCENTIPNTINNGRPVVNITQNICVSKPKTLNFQHQENLIEISNEQLETLLTHQSTDKNFPNLDKNCTKLVVNGNLQELTPENLQDILSQNDTIPNNLNTNNIISNKKLSYIYSNSVKETVYSSDSDCEYEIIKTAVKIKSANLENACKICKKRFSLPENLQKHATKHHVVNKTNSFSCSYCQRAFKSASNLSNHVKTHLQNVSGQNKPKNVTFATRLTCNICRKCFLDELKYENHIASHEIQGEMVGNVQENTKLHTCGYCKQTFTTFSHLKVHVKGHFSKKNHQCSICGKPFSSSKYLAVHLKTHQKDNKYSCVHCEKSFSAKGNYTEHLRTHTGEKPFSCSKCGKGFSHNSGLTQHLKTHDSSKNYVCTVCDKTFRWSGHYKMHMRKHSGKKQFKCQNCEKSFVNKSTLVVHERTHTGDRPYKCQGCQKGFIKSSGLQQHYKSNPEHKNTQAN